MPHLAPTAGDRIASYIRQRPGERRFELVQGRDPHARVAGEQYVFELPLGGTVTFVSYLACDYLDLGIHDVFRAVPAALGAARRLERKGIYLLGQLVQMSRAELTMRRFADEGVAVLMSEHLTKVGFRFGMHLPVWERTRNPTKHRLYG